MKYLFVTNDLGYSENANSFIVKLVCDELSKLGNDVCLFSSSQFVKDRKNHQNQYITFQFGPKTEISEYSKRLESIIDVWKVVPVLFRPNLWLSAVRVLLRKWNVEKALHFESFFAARRIKRLYRQHRFDRIIAVCEPGISMSIASKLDHPNVSIYQLDPYYSNATKCEKLKEWRLNIEDTAYKRAKKIYTTKLIADEANATKLSTYSNKLEIVEFPLIRHRKYESAKPIINFGEGKINCLFCGTLDIVYRNPAFVLELARELGDDYHFHFVGQNCLEVLASLSQSVERNIFSYHAVTNQELNILLRDANILINIGNTMSNQMPSKLIDYFSTGKPILNFMKRGDCITQLYTARYPLALDVLEHREIAPEVLQTIDAFCRTNRRTTLPYMEIEKRFVEFTPRYVASIIDSQPKD